MVSITIQEKEQKNKELQQPQRVPWRQKEIKRLVKAVKQCTNNQAKRKKINWIEVSRIVGNRNPRQCEEKYRRVWAQKQAYKDEQNKNYWTTEDENKLQNLVQIYGLQWQLFEDYFQKRSWLQIKQKYYNDLRRKHANEYKFENNTISSNSENSEKTKSDNELVLAEDELFWSRYGSNYGIKVENRNLFTQKNLIKQSEVLN